MSPLSTAARSRTPNSVFSIINHSATAVTTPQAITNSRCAGIMRKPRSNGPRSISGSGIGFEVGPKM